MSEANHNWEPLSIQEVAELLSGLSVPWWIAGGYAIDLFVGRETRSHGDMDVLIRRDDQLEVQRYLSDWDMHKTQQPGLKPWPIGEFQDRPFDDIWCRWKEGSPWQLQLMLLDTDGDQWVFKRDQTIRGSIDSLGILASIGVFYIAPEIQLLYKARLDTLDKDEFDFQTAIPFMEESSCTWLLECLEKRFPGGHSWIDQLKKRQANTSH
ncbi:MAG: amino acid transporter [Candidatus Aegiribacteria sp.]|nr:amino acid transporter [Candidatus Aegiribacteria sp.]